MPHLRRILIWAFAPTVIAAVSTTAPRMPLVTFNGSKSVPVGFYRLTTAPVALGDLIAFRVPAAGQAYAAVHLKDRLATSILKPVAASAGARVCSQQGWITIDGRRRAKAAAADSDGRPLPGWTGCRTLSSGEWLVLSTRISNSFDSRYFGPVNAKELIGVYRPLWTQEGLGRAAPAL